MERETKDEFNKINKSIKDLSALTTKSIKDLSASTRESIRESVEDLAASTARGFEQTVNRTEWVEFKNEIYEFQTETRNNFRSLRNDIWGISNNFVDKNEFEDLSLRVKYLETKLGIESGK